MSLALSIIIPVYNCEKTIRKCLDSIFIQKNDLKYEIIIVDDGSSDGTVEVVESVIAGRGNVKFIHQENAGAGAARNKALRYASGDYLLFIDGDDYISSNSLNILKIEMQFLPDVYVPCEVCHGKRYNRETLEVKYKGKNIFEVLDMNVDEACEFFESVPSIRRKIETLRDVGLSYIKLGQPSTTLSGGEAQRVKLATELSRQSTGKTIYVLDEPTTGLHFADVHKLVDILQRLTEGGNTVVVIEHNLEVIKTADYIIDMGPEGGEGGGTMVTCGTPEEVAAVEESYTGKYLKKYLNPDLPQAR